MLTVSQLHGFNVAYDVLSGYSVQYTCDTGGSISGEASQNIAPGEDASPVSVAITNLSLGFLEWSDHDTSYPTRQDLNVTQDITVNAELVSKGSNWPATFYVQFTEDRTNYWSSGSSFPGTTVSGLTTYVNDCGVPSVSHSVGTCRWEVYDFEFYSGIEIDGLTYGSLIYETETSSYVPGTTAGDYYCNNTITYEGDSLLRLKNTDTTVSYNGTCYVANGTMYLSEITGSQAMTYFNLPTIVLSHAATSTKRVYELTSASYEYPTITATYTRKDN